MTKRKHNWAHLQFNFGWMGLAAKVQRQCQNMPSLFGVNGFGVILGAKSTLFIHSKFTWLTLIFHFSRLS